MDECFSALKARQREIRDGFDESLGLRVHRALSWLQRAEQEEEDSDARFIFLWIAFNAAYANELEDRAQFSERGLFANFVQRLVGLDTGKQLYNLVWQEFPRSIRQIINNQYIYQPFWDHHNGRIDAADWQERFERSKKAANKALGDMDTAKVLLIVLERLYTLRNQLVHGGATWNSQINREQVRDGANIMHQLVPVLIHTMMENANEVWGAPCYPVVKS